MLNPFTWARRKWAECVVLGTADGLRAIAPDGEESPGNIDELRAILAQATQSKALPPTDEGEPTRAKKK